MKTLLYRTDSDKSWSKINLSDVGKLDRLKGKLFIKCSWKLITINPRNDEDAGMVEEIVGLASRSKLESGSFTSDGRFMARWRVDVSRQLMQIFTVLALLTLPVVAIFHPAAGVEPVWLGMASLMRSQHMRGVI